MEESVHLNAQILIGVDPVTIITIHKHKYKNTAIKLLKPITDSHPTLKLISHRTTNVTHAGHAAQHHSEVPTQNESNQLRWYTLWNCL